MEAEEPSRLNFSSTAPYVFHSVFGLLQQWPNTFFGFGHTIAPCTILRNTNLFHARLGDEAPPSPEWFAFDPEMSYAILGTFPKSRMWTYRTVKDVKCLYFDGTSASLVQDGSMDSQMVLIHNNSANVPDYPHFGRPPPSNGPQDGNRTLSNPIVAEYDRANGLCDFIKDKHLGGPGWGYEAVVRMNAGFEVIWCNFTSPSACLISSLNVSAPMLEDAREASESLDPLEDKPSKPPRKGGGPGPGSPYDVTRNPFWEHDGTLWAWFHAAAKRYGFAGSVPGRGETRVKIDTCGLFTLYDPALSDQARARVETDRKRLNLTHDGHWIGAKSGEGRSAALQELGRRRKTHRAVNVSVADGVYMRQAVEDRMRATLALDSEIRFSGIDWVGIAQDIVSIYSLELYDLAGMLSNISNVDDKDVRQWLGRVRNLAHAMYMPYYEYPVYTNATLRIAFSTRAPESQAAMHRCRSQFEPADLSELSTSENVTYTATLDVLTAVCGSVLPVFLSAERVWLAHFNNASGSAPLPSETALQDLKSVSSQNLRTIEELMAWLGWVDQWTACSPGCKLGEVCYVPMWPIMAMPPRRRQNGTEGPPGMSHDDDRLWQPVCVDATHFLPA